MVLVMIAKERLVGHEGDEDEDDTEESSVNVRHACPVHVSELL